jgi:PPP family 3-phenylpropionic acid transporter
MGLVLAALPAIGIVSPALAGAAADALHLRGSLVRIASAAMVIAFALVAASGAAGAAGAAVPLLGLGVVLYASARPPVVLISDVLALEALGNDKHRYGSLRLWGSAGFLFGVVAVGRFVDPAAPMALPLTIAGLYALALVAGLRLPTKAPPIPKLDRASFRAAIPRALFLLAAFFSQIGHAAYDLCFTLHARDLGVPRAKIGVLWGAGVLFEILLMRASARILARLGARRLFVLGLAGAAARWLALAEARSLFVLALLTPLHALSFGCVWVAGVSLASRTKHPATSQGLFAAALAVGATVGMLAWGTLYDARGGSAVFAGASASAAVATALAAAMWRRSRGADERAPR